MKLTDAERLIIYNQYRILAKLEPDLAENRYAVDERKVDLYETSYFAYPLLPDQIAGEQLDFRFDVLELYEKSGEPFYGFENKCFNVCARFSEIEIAEGTPPSDDEYRAMLVERERGIEHRKAGRLSEPQQVG